MDERVTTRAEFGEAVRRLATALGELVWEQVVEQGQTAGADGWLREQGGALQRRILGAAWTARSERLGVSGSCGCGGTLRFRQHQCWLLASAHDPSGASFFQSSGSRNREVRRRRKGL